MSKDDVLFGFRLRLFTLAEERGNVSEACRLMGVHRSTYYRWRRQADRWGIEALRVRERRRPRMPNEIGPHLEQKVIAFSLSHPGCGARRISAELARPKWGGVSISEHGVWRVLCRVGLNTRNKRLSLIARHRDPYERKPPSPPPERHVEAERPGEKVGIDCFYLGRLSGRPGTVWQYTAIDVASGYAWAELHRSERNPRARHTRELVHRVARELKERGWRLESVISDMARSSAPRSSPRRSTSSVPAIGASVPAAPPQTVTWSACSRRSSRSAGARRSRGRCRSRSRRSRPTWMITSRLITGTAPTPAG